MDFTTMQLVPAGVCGAFGVLVALVNIVVEVLKKTLCRHLPVNLLAVLVAQALTLLGFFAWAARQQAACAWYQAAGAVVVGFLVAYAAMFGFDKIKELLAAFSGAKEGK